MRIRCGFEVWDEDARRYRPAGCPRSATKLASCVSVYARNVCDEHAAELTTWGPDWEIRPIEFEEESTRPCPCGCGLTVDATKSCDCGCGGVRVVSPQEEESRA